MKLKQACQAYAEAVLQAKRTFLTASSNLHQNQAPRIAKNSLKRFDAFGRYSQTGWIQSAWTHQPRALLLSWTLVHFSKFWILKSLPLCPPTAPLTWQPSHGPLNQSLERGFSFLPLNIYDTDQLWKSRPEYTGSSQWDVSNDPILGKIREQLD